MNYYDQLCAISKAIKLPEIFTTDLTEHDRKRLLQEDPPISFGWIARECGTLLLDSRMDLDSVEAYQAHVAGSGKSSADQFYVAHMGSIQKTNCDGLFKFLRDNSKPQGKNRY